MGWGWNFSSFLSPVAGFQAVVLDCSVSLQCLQCWRVPNEETRHFLEPREASTKRGKLQNLCPPPRHELQWIPVSSIDYILTLTLHHTLLFFSFFKHFPSSNPLHNVHFKNQFWNELRWKVYYPKRNYRANKPGVCVCVCWTHILFQVRQITLSTKDAVLVEKSTGTTWPWSSARQLEGSHSQFETQHSDE